MNKLNAWVRAMAITLLIAMVYYFAGYRIVYSIVMHDAKEDAAFAMKHHGTFSSIILTAKEYSKLSWTEKGKEFNYNGQLYDMVSVEKSGDSYTLKVYEDKNETHWAKAMNDFVKFIFPSDQNQKQDPAEGFISAFQKEYTPLEKVKIGYAPETTKVIYDTNRCTHSSLLLIKPIWHPPLF
jgi:hypothetical protein